MSWLSWNSRDALCKQASQGEGRGRRPGTQLLLRSFGQWVRRLNCWARSKTWDCLANFIVHPQARICPSSSKLEFAQKQRNHSRLLASYFIFWEQIHEISFLKWSQSPCPVNMFSLNSVWARTRTAFPDLGTEAKSLGPYLPGDLGSRLLRMESVKRWLNHKSFHIKI